MEQEEFLDAQLVSEVVPGAPPVRWREWLVVVLLVALADWTIYRGFGYAGWAVFFVAVPVLMLWGAPPARDRNRSRCWAGMLVTGALLLPLGLKMFWCGWPLQVVLATALLLAFGAAQAGAVPTITALLSFVPRVILGGLLGLAAYVQSIRRPTWGIGRWGCLSVLMPLGALVSFGLIFLLANPDLLRSFGVTLERWLGVIGDWFRGTAPPWLELAFWLAMAWIAIGLLRPVPGPPGAPPGDLGVGVKRVPRLPVPSGYYAAARNTLVAVVALFALYLVFEFRTLWFREFPDGFYYSGYAHRGAFWLTVALAMATLTLSLVFRGSILQDPRVKSLRAWAWLWSFENLLLALAVYHRLSIYVDFNGMTRMRVVGILGITSVLVGFLFVVWKMARERSFRWLLQRQLWTVSLAVYLYGVLPVDSLVMGYNVRRILAGEAAPAVQITEHAVSAEGVLMLFPLLDCDDALVREGIGAYLATRYDEQQALQRLRKAQGWTAFQYADQLLYWQLRARDGQLARYQNRPARTRTYAQFREYVYQWY